MRQSRVVEGCGCAARFWTLRNGTSGLDDPSSSISHNNRKILFFFEGVNSFSESAVADLVFAWHRSLAGLEPRIYSIMVF